MARRGWSTSNYYRYAGAVVTGVPLTIACWAKTSITNAYQALAGIYASGSNHQFNLSFDDPADGVVAQAIGAASGTAVTSTAISANTWFHACAVFASITSRSAYLNGAGKGTNTASVTPASLNRTSIGCRDHNVTDLPWAPAGTGDIAEVAIWNVALSDADVVLLARGVSPLMVRPDALVAYWPLIGSYSPEINLKSNVAVQTVIGTLTASAHARVFYPTRRFAAAAGAQAYILTAALGTYTLTGVAALQKITKVAAAGAYTLTGVAALKKISKVAAAGAYALTGVAVLFHKTLSMAAAAGAYTLTGVAALKKISKVAAAGAYTLTGMAALFAWAVHFYTLTAAAGSYAVTGVATILTWVTPAIEVLRHRVAAPVLAAFRAAEVALTQQRNAASSLQTTRSASPFLSLRRTVKATFSRLRGRDPSL